MPCISVQDGCCRLPRTPVPMHPSDWHPAPWVRPTAALVHASRAKGCDRQPCCGCALVGARLQQDRAHDAKLAEAHAKVLAALDEAADLRPPVPLVPQSKEHHQPHPAPARGQTASCSCGAGASMRAGTQLLLDGQHTQQPAEKASKAGRHIAEMHADCQAPGACLSSSVRRASLMRSATAL